MRLQYIYILYCVLIIRFNSILTICPTMIDVGRFKILLTNDITLGTHCTILYKHLLTYITLDYYYNVIFLNITSFCTIYEQINRFYTYALPFEIIQLDYLGLSDIMG